MKQHITKPTKIPCICCSGVKEINNPARTSFNMHYTQSYVKCWFCNGTGVNCYISNTGLDSLWRDYYEKLRVAYNLKPTSKGLLANIPKTEIKPPSKPTWARFMELLKLLESEKHPDYKPKKTRLEPI